MRLNWIILLSLLIATAHTGLKGQQQGDIWLFGGSHINTNIQGYQFGNTVIDFSNIEPTIYYDSLVTMDFAGTNSSICNEEGELLLYTNGMQVFGADHQSIINGDTIAHSDIWEFWSLKNFYENGDDWIVGLPIVQGTVLLPLVEAAEEFLAVYQVFAGEGDASHVGSLNYSLIQKDEQSNFVITQKDELIFKDELTWGQVHPCRHANGRDWWLIQQSTWGDTISVFMIEKNGVHLHNQIYRERRNVALTSNQVAFNATGELYAIANGQYLNQIGGERGTVLNVFSFDRCEGTLTEIGTDVTDNTGVRGVISFSPSGRYLYTSSHEEIYQYDMYDSDWLSSRETIAVYDGFFFQYSEYGSEIRPYLGSMVLAPDGRIYSVPEGSNRFLHVIEYPDERGVSAEVRQHVIMMPTSNHTSTPNIPDYRMGPVDGSLCDSLGLDSAVKAQFRFEEDTLNYLNVRFTDISFSEIDSWYWEFGDGNTSSDQKPYFHEYEEAGVYNVCLTVGRDGAEDKFCKNIYLGVTSTENTLLSEDEVNIFPNPVSDVLSIDIKNNIPANTHIIIYNSIGELVVKQKMKSHLNQVDFRGYHNGIYHMTIVNRRGLMYSETFMKYE